LAHAISQESCRSFRPASFSSKFAKPLHDLGRRNMKAVVFVACLGVLVSATSVLSPERPMPSSMDRKGSRNSLMRKSVPISADGHVQVQASEATALLQAEGSLVRGRKIGTSILQRGRRIQSIAIFMQVFNTALWSELQPCIRNIISAKEGRMVSLYIALAGSNQTIQADAAQMQEEGGLTESYVNIVQNIGADIGAFLQQVQQHSASARKSDVFFKLHTKSLGPWRNLMLQGLCGSPRQVTRILALFENDGIGIVGPKGLTFTSDRVPAGRTDTTPIYVINTDYCFGLPGAPLGLIPEYEETWKRIYAGERSPPTVWTHCAGTWFWSRSGPILSDEHLLAAIPKFLQAWGTGYAGHYEDCLTFDCRSLYAFERVLPTIARHNRSVVEAQDLAS